MNKRVFLAIALSFLVLFSWQTIISKVYPLDNKEVTLDTLNNKGLKSAEDSLLSSTSAAVSLPVPSPASLITETITLDRFETDKLKLEFINP